MSKYVNQIQNLVIAKFEKYCIYFFFNYNNYILQFISSSVFSQFLGMIRIKKFNNFQHLVYTNKKFNQNIWQFKIM